ncbi:MAG: tetratricopeptide repeat protein [Planctomycetota bacterium]
MKRFRVGALILSAMLTCLAGCQTTVSQEKVQANSRWDLARARVLASGAEEALQLGKLDKAQADAEEALSLAPSLPEAHIAMGNIHIERGRFSAAIIQLEKALETSPRSARSAYLLGVAYEKSGNLPEALSAYQRAGRIDQSSFHATLAQAEVMAGMGQIDQARDLLEGRLDQAGDDPTAYELLGRLCMITKDYVRAENYLRTACVLDDDNPIYHKALGQAHFALGHYREAIKAMSRVVETKDYEASYTVYVILGESNLALGRAEPARDAYFTASELSPSEPNVWLGLAKAYLAAREGPRAVLAAQQAIRLDPENPDAVLLGAYAMIQNGREAEAAEMLTLAIRHHPDNAMIRCLLGQALDRSGSKPAARRAYQSALRIDPNLSLAAKLLARLDEELSRAN